MSGGSAATVAPRAASPGAPGEALRPGDRAWGRATLPRVSRTFAINIRLLNGGMADAVRTAYLLCRTADTLEDAWPGRAADVGERFDRFLDGIGGDGRAVEALAAQAAATGRGELELVTQYPRVWRLYRSLPADDRAVLREGVETLARGMRRYACRAAERNGGAGDAPYLETEAELHDYCWVVAGCVGVMLTGLFAQRVGPEDESRRARRLALAPHVGEALQLTNILLDWPVDLRHGRCYVPAEWLARRGLVPRDLVDRPGEAVTEMAGRLERLALEALMRVPDYLETIPARHARYRLFCLWPALWALGSLRQMRRVPDFPWGPRRPKLPRHELWGAAWASLLAVRDDRAVRRLYSAAR